MHEQNEVIHIAQWPTVHDLHKLASRHYAFEGRTFVLAAGTMLKKSEVVDGIKSHGNIDSEVIDFLEGIQTGEDDYVQKGGSCIIAPDTTIINSDNIEDIIYSEIDTDMISENKMTLDAAGHYSRPDIFSLSVDNSEKRNIN